MEMLSVRGLTKRYEKFEQKDVSFSLDKGYIMGFIGRNGAGKTTTIKSMLGLVHADAGEVDILGHEFYSNELLCKQEMALVLGGTDYYPKKKLRVITGVVRRFYKDWDSAAYSDYLERFEIDEDKRFEQLSSGMKLKYQLALAMSHNAKLLILDEPTSGLDPVSRVELLDIFREIIEDGEHSILFSTHITSDLDKCADFITYIKDGELVASMDKDAFLDMYRVVRGQRSRLEDAALVEKLIGCRENAFGFTALMKKDDAMASGLETALSDLETVMVHIEKE